MKTERKFYVLIEECDFKAIKEHLNNAIDVDHLPHCKAYARLALSKLVHVDASENKDYVD